MLCFPNAQEERRNYALNKRHEDRIRVTRAMHQQEINRASYVEFVSFILEKSLFNEFNDLFHGFKALPFRTPSDTPSASSSDSQPEPLCSLKEEFKIPRRKFLESRFIY